MLLEPDEAQLFFKLHRTLLFFVNQRLKVTPERFNSPSEFGDLSLPAQHNIRDALTARLDLIPAFVEENPARFTQDELDIVASWRHLIADKFYIVTELEKYTVLLTDKTVAYGVLALSMPFSKMVPSNLPEMVDTVLLPFQGKIVYDGVLSCYDVEVTPRLLNLLKEGVKLAVSQHGLVTSLPISEAPRR
jgi:hypothetical protein